MTYPLKKEPEKRPGVSEKFEYTGKLEHIIRLLTALEQSGVLPRKEYKLLLMGKDGQSDTVWEEEEDE